MKSELSWVLLVALTLATALSEDTVDVEPVLELPTPASRPNPTKQTYHPRGIVGLVFHREEARIQSQVLAYAHSLPKELRSWVEDEVQRGAFCSASEYSRHLLRDTKVRQEERAQRTRLQSLLTQGIESG